MNRRCPLCKYIGLGRLRNWKFEYDGTCDDWSNMAVGNIFPTKNSVVWAVIYSLCDSDIARLDVYEDYPNDYIRKRVSVQFQPSGTEYDVFVYTRKPQQIGKPSKKYEKTIVTGALEDGIPESYIAKYLKV